MNRIDLAGCVAVVTGGAKGIGLAIARRFLASGAEVVVWDQEEPATTHLIMETHGGGLIGAVVDVGNNDMVFDLSGRQRIDPAVTCHLKASQCEP